MGDNVKLLTEIKNWLEIQLTMKDLVYVNYVLGIQILRNRKNKILALSQATYNDKLLTWFSMQNFEEGSNTNPS